MRDRASCAKALGEWAGIVLAVLLVALVGAIVYAAWRWALGA